MQNSVPCKSELNTELNKLLWTALGGEPASLCLIQRQRLQQAVSVGSTASLQWSKYEMPRAECLCPPKMKGQEKKELGWDFAKGCYRAWNQKVPISFSFCNHHWPSAVCAVNYLRGKFMEEKRRKTGQSVRKWDQVLAEKTRTGLSQDGPRMAPTAFSPKRLTTAHSGHTLS